MLFFTHNHSLSERKKKLPSNHSVIWMSGNVVSFSPHIYVLSSHSKSRNVSWQIWFHIIGFCQFKRYFNFLILHSIQTYWFHALSLIFQWVRNPSAILSQIMSSLISKSVWHKHKSCPHLLSPSIPSRTKPNQTKPNTCTSIKNTNRHTKPQIGFPFNLIKR